MTDLISRQAAIRWVKIECNPYGNPTLDFESGKKVIEHLEQMPTIDPVKHGKWNNDETCSVCGEGFLCDTDYFNYCPNCGAIMDEPKTISAEFAKLMTEGEIQVRWKKRETD